MLKTPLLLHIFSLYYSTFSEYSIDTISLRLPSLKLTWERNQPWLLLSAFVRDCHLQDFGTIFFETPRRQENETMTELQGTSQQAFSFMPTQCSAQGWGRLKNPCPANHFCYIWQTTPLRPTCLQAAASGSQHKNVHITVYAPTACLKLPALTCA